jgi:clan AA aspartic protease
MISGEVNANLEGIVRLRIRGPGGTETELETLIDSGCDSSLVLPSGTVAYLGLVRQSTGTAMLADGSVRQSDIFDVDVQWDGNWRRVLASAIGGEPLLGTEMLAGYRLLMDVVPGGAVEITPLP